MIMIMMTRIFIIFNVIIYFSNSAEGNKRGLIDGGIDGGYHVLIYVLSE